MEDERGQLILDLARGGRLIASMGWLVRHGEFRPLLEAADPTCFLLVGSRSAPEGRPPQMSVFNVFFDSPANRPFDSYRVTARHETCASGVERAGRPRFRSATSRPGGFAGELRLTVYRGARSGSRRERSSDTDLDRRAILYDAGLAIRNAGEDPLRLGRHRRKASKAEPAGGIPRIATWRCGIGL